MTTETTEGTESVGSESTGTENTEVNNPAENTESTEASTESTVVDKEGSKETEEKESSGEGSEQDTAEAGTYYFEGQEVSIEVPDELKSTLDEVGVNTDKVIEELYGKDSDFTLSEETRKPLDEKYGKPVVDTFLNALKSQNESLLKGAADAKEAATKADQEAKEWSDEVVGGEENWTALEEWAGENLDEAQIESFNKAMQSGDKWLQELAIKDLHSKYTNSEGDTSASLISGDSASDTSGGPLSKEDYLSEMTSPSFRELKGNDKVKAQAQLDARRRAGMKKGI